MPIGQGISVTALQVASVYQTIANGGVRIAPAGRRVDDRPRRHGRRRSPAPAGARVISAPTAATDALHARGGRQHARHGAAGAAIPGYRVAGKTGTAQRADPAWLLRRRRYTSTFVGYAPADDPQLRRRGGPAGPARTALRRRRSRPRCSATHAVRLPQHGVAPPDAAAAASVGRHRPADRALPCPVPASPVDPGRRDPGRARLGSPAAGDPAAAPWPLWPPPVPRRGARRRATADAARPGITLTPARSAPGDLYAALPGARTHGARFAADAAARGAVAVLTDPDRRRGRAAATGLPVLRRRRPARRARRGRRPGLRRPVARPHACSGSPAPTARPPPATWSTPACARPATTTGLIGTVRAPGSRRATSRAERAHHARGDRPAGAARGDARARRRRRCVMEVSSHALAHGRVDGVALRRRGLHQPLRRPPRLPPRPRVLLRGQGAAVRRPRAAAGWSTSTTTHGRRLAERPAGGGRSP